MTPRVDDKDQHWLGLKNVKEFTYWARLLAQGVCGGSPKTELWFTWYGERLHLERNIRKGVERPTTILVTFIADDNTQHVASLSELKLVANVVAADDVPYSGTSLKHMYTVKKFLDQEGDAAFEMLTMRTMDIMVRAREEHSYPLLMYLLACMYILEVWVNPDFTRPYLMGLYLFTGKSLLDTFEAYIKMHGLPADMSLLSLTTRKTLDTMTHSPIQHVLKVFRSKLHGAIDLDASWSQASLSTIHTKPLEGHHGIQRTMNNTITPNLADWLTNVSTIVLKVNILNRLRENYTVSVGSNRHTRKEHQGNHVTYGMTPVPESLQKLIGIASLCGTREFRNGGPCDPSVVPLEYQGTPQDYAELMAHFEAGCRRGLDKNGPFIYETLNPQAVVQFKRKNVLLFPVKKIVVRPQGMHIVDNNDFASSVDFEPTGAVDDPCTAKPLTCAQQGFEDKLKELTQMSARFGRIEHPLPGDANVPIKATNGVVTQLPRAMAVVTNDGDWHSVTEVLATMQKQEFVARDRGPRFWTGPLPEHRALPDGHNVTHGSLLLMTWPIANLLPKMVAVVRVTHILVGSEKAKSCELNNKANSNQTFRAEICVELRGDQFRGPTGRQYEGGACFIATGRQYPGLLKACLVTHVVALQGCPHEVVANLSHEDVVAYLGTRLTFLDFVTLATIQMKEDVNDEAVDDEPPLEHVCCRCAIGWWDDSTGILQQCPGTCGRSFHANCLEELEIAAFQNLDGECNKCSGRDSEICDACGEEWYDDDKDSPYHTGKMVGCDNCNRWWHQVCHQPNVSEKDCSKAGWLCGACHVTVVPKPRAPKAKPATAAPPPKRKKPKHTLAPGPHNEPAGSRTKAYRLTQAFAAPNHKNNSAPSAPQEPKKKPAATCSPRQADVDVNLAPKRQRVKHHAVEQHVISDHHKCQLCWQMKPMQSLADFGPKCNREFQCKVPCVNQGMSTEMPKEPTASEVLADKPLFGSGDPMAWEPSHRQQTTKASGSLPSVTQDLVVRIVRCQKCLQMVLLAQAQICGPKNNKEFECKSTSICSQVTLGRKRK